MMALTNGMLDALEKYYGLEYSKVMRGAIVSAIGPKQERQYLMDIYQGVIESHPVSFRSLPDLAIIQKVRRPLSRPETYRTESATPALPEPPVSPVIDDAIKAAISRIGENGVGNPDEVKRVRDKADRRSATLYELWWLECIEKGEPYRAMPEKFEKQHADVRRW